MPARRRFSNAIAIALDQGKYLAIRAGADRHRFIGIWVVVVRGRAFVRSWTLKRDGWYRTFLRDPRGHIQINGRELGVKAVPTAAPRLNDAVDQAYLDKYNTRASLKYARGLARAKCRATTLELVPFSWKVD